MTAYSPGQVLVLVLILWALVLVAIWGIFQGRRAQDAELERRQSERRYARERRRLPKHEEET